MRKFCNRVRAFGGQMARDESGAAAVEYALLATLIGVAIVGGATLIGTNINTAFTDVAGKL